MPAVREVAGAICPTWGFYRDLILRLKEQGPDASVAADVDPSTFFIIQHVAGRGYFMSGRGAGDETDQTLLDPGRPWERVKVWCAGLEWDRPLRCLVREELVLRAARYFFRTGRRDPALEWAQERALLDGPLPPPRPSGEGERT
jgi:hypothetical protein